MNETPRQKVMRLWKDMKSFRDERVAEWKEITEYIAPRRGEYLYTDRARGTRRDSKIIDGTATQALETYQSGLHSSATNPAREWWRLTTSIPATAERTSIRAYLFNVQRIVQWLFGRSNIYNQLHTLYGDHGAYGVAPLLVDEDAQDTMRAYVLPVGQYSLATSDRQQIDTCGRELTYTVRQLVHKFGENAVSRRVREWYRRSEYNQSVKVVHMILPNEDYEIGRLDAKGKLWRSLWVELVADETEGLLRDSGYRQFPVMAVRYEVAGTDDIYGYGPGHIALPDVRQLQHTAESKLGLIDLLKQPPMNGPASMRSHTTPSVLPGAMNWQPDNSNQEFKPSYLPAPESIIRTRETQAEIQYMVRKAFKEDLWRMLADRQAQDPRMTAFEVSMRRDEQLILLGPAVERLHNELLSPLIRRAINILSEARMLPPPPDDLVDAMKAGEDVRIEYLSVMAQAQKTVGLGALERFAAVTSQIAATDPTGAVLDKVDRDELIDQLADMTGIPPSVVRSDEDVAQMRMSRVKAAQAQAQMAQAQAQAQTAKTLAQAPLGEDSALSRLLQAYGPQAAGVQAGMPGTGVTP